MFMLLLQVAQQTPTLAKQLSPNLYVTVQPSPGMPEWVKILITAAVGALVGIASNIAMEYVKPGIVKRQKRELIAQHLNAELCANMSAITAAKRVLEGLMKDSTRQRYGDRLCRQDRSVNKKRQIRPIFLGREGYCV
jgi:hypothetical protein